MIERPVTLTDESRAAMTGAATGAARANKPRWLIYLGGLAVLVALIYTGYNLSRRVAAQASLSSRQSEFDEVKTEVDLLMKIKAEDEALGGDRAVADSRMADKISKIATESGLVISSVTEGDDQRPNPSKTVKRKRYDFKLLNQPAEPAFAWLKRATAELGGLQLNRIDITPADGNEGKPGWNISVTFTRWERVS